MRFSYWFRNSFWFFKRRLSIFCFLFPFLSNFISRRNYIYITLQSYGDTDRVLKFALLQWRDTNQDGRLAKDEVEPAFHKKFDNGDHDGDGYIAALERNTGKVRWKIDRKNKTRSYVTPIIREIDGRTQMVLSGSKSVVSYDPATGKEHWFIDGPTEQFVASMVYDGKLLFITGGYPARHILAIRPDGRGNVTDTHIAWRTNRGAAYVPSPIVEGPYFLIVSDNGIASCFEAKSGKRLWMERLGGGHSASTVSAGGLVYFVSDKGVTTVVRPGSKFDVISKNELGERCSSSPAISAGTIYIRGHKNLFAIRTAEK